MILRDYQERAVEACLVEIRHGRNPLCVAPTGTGKTESFIALIERYTKENPNKRVLVLLNRVLLWKQTERRVSSALGKVGVVCGSEGVFDDSHNVTIATVGSVKKIKQAPDLIIVDEAHNVGENETYVKNFDRFKEANPAIVIAGFTATPYRASGYIYGPGKLWSKPCFDKDIMWFFENGYLVPPTMKHSDHAFSVDGLKTRMGDWDAGGLSALASNGVKVGNQVKDALGKLRDRNKIAWTCINTEHANMITKFIGDYGEKAVCVHSKIEDEEIQNAMREFEHGDARHLVFVSMLSEGVNIPAIDAMVLMRPTKSPTRYVQCVGRALRTFPGKKDALVIDYGRVVQNCGPINNPNVKQNYAGKKKDPTEMRICKSCASIYEATKQKCPDCGAVYVSERQRSDYTSNTTSKSTLGEILSGKAKVGNSFVEPVSNIAFVRESTTRSGEKCAIVTFTPKNLLKSPVRYWLLEGYFLRKKTLEIFGETFFTLSDLLAKYKNQQVKTLITALEIGPDGFVSGFIKGEPNGNKTQAGNIYSAGLARY